MWQVGADLYSIVEKYKTSVFFLLQNASNKLGQCQS